MTKLTIQLADTETLNTITTEITTDTTTFDINGTPLDPRGGLPSLLRLLIQECSPVPDRLAKASSSFLRIIELSQILRLMYESGRYEDIDAIIKDLEKETDQ